VEVRHIRHGGDGVDWSTNVKLFGYRSVLEKVRMRLRRPPVLAVASVFSLLLVGCGSSNGQRDAVKGIGAVQVSVAGGSLGGLFPRKPRTISCTLGVGGPSPGSAISGTCETRVKVEGRSAVVEFIERWDSRDFRMNTSRTGELTHTWEFSVSKTGHVTAGRDYGDDPPQFAD
jgi:hypothetical protein